MAQLEQKISDTGKSPDAITTTQFPTFQQLLLQGDAASCHQQSSGVSSPLPWRQVYQPQPQQHSQEDENSGTPHKKLPLPWWLRLQNQSHSHDDEISSTPQRKSVLKRVRERARKLRRSLSGKKKHGSDGLQDDYPTSPWSAGSFDDPGEVDEDPEYLGAPMYESELAPEAYKEAAKLHPRFVPVASEKHVLASSVTREDEDEQLQEKSPGNENAMNNSPAEKQVPTPTPASNSSADKAGPALATASNATDNIANKIAGLTVIAPAATPTKKASQSDPEHATADDDGENAGAKLGKLKLERSPGTGGCAGSYSSPQTWDKGVSVREYLRQKLEPGDNERALSQVISEAISPRKSTHELGVVEKVRAAVTSLLRYDQTSRGNLIADSPDLSSQTPSSNLPWHSEIPISSSVNNVNSSSQIHPPSYSEASISSNATTGNSSSLIYPPSRSEAPITSNATNANSSSQICIPQNPTKSSSNIPTSTSAYEAVEEENCGRILQAN